MEELIINTYYTGVVLVAILLFIFRSFIGSDNTCSKAIYMLSVFSYILILFALVIALVGAVQERLIKRD